MTGRAPTSPDRMFSPGRKMEPVVKSENPEDFTGRYTESLGHDFDRRLGNVSEDALNLLQNDEQISPFPRMLTADFPNLGEVDFSGRAESFVLFG